MKTLFGRTFQVMEKALDVCARRNAVITANVANVDTPGYRARDIPFREVMARYLAKTDPTAGDAPGRAGAPPELARTRPGHLPGLAPEADRPDPARTGRERGVPNDVDLDREMARLAENNLRYQVIVRSMAKSFEELNLAITEGGKS
ncbi:flagellar basal body rod protein FlgB [Dissulfurirhabdus thermomarina]|uniref:Flagellar basal body rod protein FlgB n=1 Tax=Dissulfurirhabdus thermomarina TaxID=1765737 RepID=A0A6N9TNL6_DISTH|nr:flagellar basal body rod protein FlgB [Dissulfurirhabdus thermomarina]NDY42881.1 flagellar basal body rod protein FlgB [Dissulfurirhabdus thermomarina]NMX23898.1 flagellar basal body rod protein FlgB [Dissulfurirhabdus thermomarina]